MPTCAIRFTAGRYHATPWGHHVNEGQIDWPPAPWRLLRALLAVGFTKLGWTDPVRISATARSLVERLASVRPSYRLPSGATAHLRHYMPIQEGSKSKTTKVLDAFLICDREEDLLIHWPIEIPPEERELLTVLLGGLGYLGRAESWCEARLLDEDPSIGENWSTPDPGGGRPLPIDQEQVAVLCPVDAASYRAWWEQRPAAMRSSKRTSDPYPPDLVAALCCNTARLQKDGWSQPPGSQLVLYRRPVDCLEPAVPRSSPPRIVARSVPAVLLALASEDKHGRQLPLRRRALPLTERLHQTLIKFACGEGSHCLALTGRAENGVPLTGHHHASLIPIDRDEDGRIDHILVHAPMGLEAKEQRLLMRVGRTYGKGLPPIRVSFAGMGELNDISRALATPHGGEPSELANARVWHSRMPFIAPRHLKPRGKNTLEGQIRAECRSRGLPEPERIDLWSPDRTTAQGFLRAVRSRSDEGRRPPDTRPWGLTLVFPEPVRGPITLGYASHFGLGLFTADN